MFVSFISAFTQFRMVTSQGIYGIRCRSFYIKLAFFNELHLTLQSDFLARCVFDFLPMPHLLKKFVHRGIDGK